MAAPTLIDYAESTWTDPSVTTETTDDLNWDSAGDVVVVLGATEDNGLTIATPTGTGLTLAALSGLPSNTGSSCKVYGWSATAAGDGNTVLTSTNGASAARGIAAWSWAGSTGLGTPVVNVGSGITVSVTVAADSSVVMVLADWNATTDVTVDTVPAGGTIRQNNTVSGLATYLVVQWDAQAAGTRSYGVSNWTGTGTVSKVAVEVLGSAGASPAPTTAAATGTAHTPAVAVTITAGTATAAGAAFDPAAGTALAAPATEAAATGTAYGATVSTGGGGSTESLFVSWTPASGNENEGTPLARGLTFYAAVAGDVLGVRVYATTTVSTSIETVNLWQITGGEADPGPGTGMELAEKVAPAPLTAASWNDILFDSPVAISANTAYKVGSNNDQGRYVATAADLLTDVTVGNLTAVGASGSGTFPLLGTIRNGTYEYAAAGTYPNDFSGAPNYGIDVIFQASAGGGTNAPATEATATGAAFEPTVAVEVLPAEATAAGTALGPAAAVSGTATEATGSGSATGPATALGVNAATAASTGAAQDPTVSTSVSGTANPGTATAVGEALWDAGSSVALDLIADNPVEATGAAFNATVSTAASTNASATTATAAGTALDPTVTTSSSASAPALEATATGVALGPAVALTAAAIEASAVGTALGATVSTVPMTNADAGLATATGAAIDPVAAVQVLAAAATAVAQAFGPSILIGAPGSANAGTAAATGQAFPARVSKRTPRPNTGSTVRPYAGVTARP